MNLLPLAALRAAFSGRLCTDAGDMSAFLTDWRGKWTGRAIAVAQPDTAHDVAAVLRWCQQHRVPVVPQGGNTGLSGGATPDVSGAALVLSLTRLNRVRRIDAVNNTIEAEAGVTLQQLQDAARDAGRLFPLSLAAQGTCTIGGNLATNAGGVQVLRYGNARELCLGLEVVTPQGELWNGLRGLRKDNTGYALRDLYIGSEGTLGVITAAVLKLHPLPAAQVAAFVAVPSPEAALQLLELAQLRLGAGLTAFELMSDICLGLVEQHVVAARRPLSEPRRGMCLLEVSDAQDDAHATAAIEGLLEAALARELSPTLRSPRASRNSRACGRCARTSPKPRARKARPSSTTSRCRCRAYPGSSPPPTLPSLRLFRVFAWSCSGTWATATLHYNVSPPAGKGRPEHEAAFVALEAGVNRLVHDAVAAQGGSISAEHGLGVLRRDESARYKPEVELRLMRAIKAALDPRGLMNPGKVLAIDSGRTT
jgi:FAD/FMN-containing dehydrogenase